LVQDDYASKARALLTCWLDISPNGPPSSETDAIFDALTFSDYHSSPDPQAPGGYHAEVVEVRQPGVREPTYRTYYFRRPLTAEEKHELDALYKRLTDTQSSGGAKSNIQ
jgi:hypothetical protein